VVVGAIAITLIGAASTTLFVLTRRPKVLNRDAQIRQRVYPGKGKPDIVHLIRELRAANTIAIIISGLMTIAGLIKPLSL
jgi:hypothetical protein